MGEKVEVNEQQCYSCPFNETSNRLPLPIERMNEIYGYLANGTNHMCHSTSDETVCRGGRNFQLQILHRMGLITEPTDNALNEAMKIMP